MTIDASTLAGAVHVDGNHASRIFNISGGAVVRLDSLFITNGYAGGSGINPGGGILSAGDLTVVRCTFAGNLAGFTGGGLEVDNHTLVVSECAFFGNQGTRGGGGGHR